MLSNCLQRCLSRTRTNSSRVLNKTYFASFHLSHNFSKSKTLSEFDKVLNQKPATKKSKDQQDLEDLQALLEDEEILTPQKKTSPPKSSSNDTSPRQKALENDPEMKAAMKDLGFDGRWENYQDIINSFESMNQGRGMDEQGLSEGEDEFSLNDPQTKNAYKMFGEKYFKSLKTEFDNPELFNLIKSQVDSKTGPDDFASVLGSMGIGGKAQQQEKPAQQATPKQQQQSAKPQEGTAQKEAEPVPSKSSKKKKGLTMADIDSNFDFDFNADEVMKDFQNPAMRKMMKEMLGVQDDTTIDNLSKELQSTMTTGKSLTGLQNDLDKQMKELESLLSFAEDLKGTMKSPSSPNKPSKKKK